MRLVLVIGGGMPFNPLRDRHLARGGAVPDEIGAVASQEPRFSVSSEFDHAGGRQRPSCATHGALTIVPG